jgi:CheY-like chemotaxis protein
LKGVEGQILIVEDDAALRKLLRSDLETEGWSVVEAASGRQAMMYVARHQPALILLDLMLPEMNGIQVVDELRTSPAGRSIPIVVITAKDLSPAERQHLSSSVEQILQKGAYSRNDLLRQIRDLMYARQSYQGNRIVEEPHG